jgi:hypothetical protein
MIGLRDPRQLARREILLPTLISTTARLAGTTHMLSESARGQVGPDISHRRNPVTVSPLALKHREGTGDVPAPSNPRLPSLIG